MQEGLTNGTITFDQTHETRLSMLHEASLSSFLEEFATFMSFKLTYKEGDNLLWDSCTRCGKHITYTLRGNNLVPKDDVCFKSAPVEFSVNFPSGDLLVVDHLKLHRDLFSQVDSDAPRLSSDFGLLKRTELYSNLNVVHFFAADYTPSVYTVENGVKIGLDNFDDYDNPIPFVSGEYRGSVDTDIWWVTVIDIETLTSLLKLKYTGKELAQKLANEISDADVRVKIEPGKYTMRYIPNDREEREQLMCSITLSE